MKILDNKIDEFVAILFEDILIMEQNDTDAIFSVILVVDSNSIFDRLAEEFDLFSEYIRL